MTGILLGGNSGAVNWTQKSSDHLAGLLREALADHPGKLLITTSRRTPDILREAVLRALPHAWCDPDGSAYSAILALSDRLIVTGDSHNMVSEALATGAPVYVYRPDGLQPKLHSFLGAMEAAKAVKPLESMLEPMLEPFPGKRIDANEEIATAILQAIAKG